MSGHVFISHSSKDDGFVRELRETLEGLGLEVWVDSRRLRGGAKLAPEVEEAIKTARHFVAVLSPNAVNSEWVGREIESALKVEGARRAEGYRVVPLMLPGIEPPALRLWFGQEPVGVRVEVGVGGLAEALPDILAALGERSPDDRQRDAIVASQPVEELILKLEGLKVETKDGKRRACAVAQLVYEPADTTARTVESRRFNFTAPLGVIEAEELRWYLEEFYVWPIGIFQERAARVEARLPEWGQALYHAALAPEAARDTLSAWQQAGADTERRFSVFVESEPPVGASTEEQAEAAEAAAELLALPWELLHDGGGFLFHGARPALARRRLPNRRPQKVRPTQLPIRILLISPRPEDEHTPYLDHRISARPLVEALEGLGELAKLSILTPPTLAALEESLTKAAKLGEPFDVVHFDGHGVYDRRMGLGALCFEDPKDAQASGQRAVQLIHAEQLAGVIRHHGIPLVFLEACQTAKTEDDPTASVAAKLLEEGVASVVAMSHTVLVETARRFVGAFYGELARGGRVGAAMIAGQRELHRDDYRGKLMGVGDLRLQDWFVPVLYQEEQDAQLVTRLPPEDVQGLQAKQRRLSLGRLPDPPPHEFQGRSRELLALERLLAREPYAVVRGRGGEGKTTLAVELARWLVRTGRFRRAAFVSFEQYTDARGVLVSLGQQLLPEGNNWHVAPDEELDIALQPVEQALRDRPTVILLDNLESVLPDHTGQQPPGAAPLEELFDLCRKLLDASPATRIVFTTREPLPAPFDQRGREIPLGALAREDAVALVGEVMKKEGLTPKADDPGADPQEVTELVEAVDRHARALVLLARELARTGVRTTTENIRRLLADLDRKHPNDRENSLYASLELSLRRLPPETRAQLKPLAVFHGGVSLFLLSHMLGSDKSTILNLAKQLISIGLATYVGETHLRLDPALPSFLLRGMSESETLEWRAKWAELMDEYARFLYRQRFENTDISNRVTLLELPNLLALLEWKSRNSSVEDIVQFASALEFLIAPLGRSRELAEARMVRQQAAQQLPADSVFHFEVECNEIEQLISRGDLPKALNAAETLLRRLLNAGETAYQDAGYDIAIAYHLLGRIFWMIGKGEVALEILTEARHRFQLLADTGSVAAKKMLRVVESDIGICLSHLGRIEDATALLENQIKVSESLSERRNAAVDKINLGYLYLQQGKYIKALEIVSESKQAFENLGEPMGLAKALHQLGIIHRYARNFQQAEHAYKEALAITVQEKDAASEASALDELGILYSQMGLLEYGVAFFKQAAATRHKMGDVRAEGVSRGNLGIALLKLKRYDEARRELELAIECRTPYGHAAETWNTWHALSDLEKVANNPQSAAHARQKAIESYLAYRRDGGVSISPCARLCLQVAQAIVNGNADMLEQQLGSHVGAEISRAAKARNSKLQAILHGNRSPALANDPDLFYQDAVELQLLLDKLVAK